MVFIRKFKRKVIRFVGKHEKKFLVVVASAFIIIGPHFGGSLVGDAIDKMLVASTVVANGRILEIF